MFQFSLIGGNLKSQYNMIIVVIVVQMPVIIINVRRFYPYCRNLVHVPT